MFKSPGRLVGSLSLVALASAAAISGASAAPKAATPAPIPSPSESASAAPALAASALPSTARVSMGTPRAVGSTVLPSSAANQLLRLQPAIESCWEDERTLGDARDASLDVRLEIVGPGKVASATITSSTEASKNLRGCVRDAFAGYFPGSVGPAPVEASVHIELAVDASESGTRPTSACSATCDGELDDEALAAIRLRAQETSVCFKRPAAAGEPPVLKAGAVDVLMRIAPDGSVCGVSLAGDAFDRPSLGSCVRETFARGYAFTPTGCVDVRVPLRFKGN